MKRRDSITLFSLIMMLIFLGPALQAQTSGSVWSNVNNLEIFKVPYPTAELVPDATIIWEIPIGPNTLDPHCSHNWVEPAGTWISDNIYETLFTFPWDSSDTDPLIPFLAESLHISDDGLNYTFTLRQGIVFHDGTAFNASCVKYNIERVLAIFLPLSAVGLLSGKLLGGQAVEDAVIDFGPGSDEHVEAYHNWIAQDSIKVLSTYTVRIRLAYPWAPFLQALTSKIGCIISPTFVEKHGGIQIGQVNVYIASHTCGTGPYMVNNYIRNDLVALCRNNNYWRAPDAQVLNPYSGSIETVIIRTNGDFESYRPRLLTGMIDGCDWPADRTQEIWNPQDQTSLYPEIQVWADSLTYNVYYLGFNQYDYIRQAGQLVPNPLKFINLRNAISYAFDYQALIDSTLNGLGVQARGPIPQGLLGHNDGLFMHSFSIDLAVEEWNAAMAKGLGDVWASDFFTLEIYGIAGDSVREQTCLLIKTGIESILNHPDAIQPSQPLTVVVTSIDWAQYIDLEESRETPVYFLGWAPEYAEPDDYVREQFTSYGLYSPLTGYSSPEIDCWIEQAVHSLSETERIELYSLVQDAIVESMSYLWCYQEREFSVERIGLHGHSYNPVRQPYFYHYWKTMPSSIPINEIHSSSWWRNEIGFLVTTGTGLTYDRSYIQNLVNAISYSSEIFSSIKTIEEAWSILAMLDGTRSARPALRELYSLWLNLANDALNGDTETNLGGFAAVCNVREVVLLCEGLLLDEMVRPQDMTTIARICREINNG